MIDALKNCASARPPRVLLRKEPPPPERWHDVPNRRNCSYRRFHAQAMASLACSRDPQPHNPHSMVGSFVKEI